MAEIIYELLFMIPLCLIGTFLSLPHLGTLMSKAVDFAEAAGMTVTAGALGAAAGNAAGVLGTGGVAGGIGTSVSPVFVHGSALLILGILMVCKHWKNKLKYLLPGILCTTFVVLIALHKKETRLEYVLQNLWILHTALIAVGAFLAGWMLCAKLWMQRIVSVVTVILLILNMVIWKTDAKAAVALSLFLIVLHVSNEVQHGWKKSGYTDLKKHLVTIAPFLLIFAVSVLALPAPGKPLDWSAVVRFYENTRDYIKTKTVKFHSGEEDYEAMIGFSDDGLFVGSLGKNAKEVMTLSTASGGEKVIYLGGKTMDTFDGRVWSESYTEANHDKRMDTMELLCAITAFDEANETDYIRRTSVKLQLKDFYTRYCFVPEKLIPTNNALSLPGCSEEGGELISGEELGYGSEYTAFYYRLNRGNEAFGDFLEHSSNEVDQKTWDRVRNQYLPGEKLPYEEYLAYRERVRELYLPKTPLSPQAERYIEELVTDKEKDSKELTPDSDKESNPAISDYETLCRIEEALSELSYTTTPGKLPETVSSQADFLDYFLFEKQEGYCSFFATAFVLMARNRGIPARVVHGFRVNTKGKKETQVSSDTAHAWAEAYLDGAGWFIFDPTPGSETGNYWLTREESTSYNPPEKVPEKVTDPTIPSTVTPVGGEPIQKKRFFNWKWALILVISTVIFGILYFVLYKVISGATAKKSSQEQRFLAGVKKNFRVLEILGYQRESGETLEEFRVRAGKKIAPKNLDFIGNYEVLCYSGQSVGEQQQKECEENFRGLLTHLKNTKGKGLIWLYLRIYYA